MVSEPTEPLRSEARGGGKEWMGEEGEEGEESGPPACARGEEEDVEAAEDCRAVKGMGTGEWRLEAVEISNSTGCVCWSNPRKQAGFRLRSIKCVLAYLTNDASSNRPEKEVCEVPSSKLSRSSRM